MSSQTPNSRPIRVALVLYRDNLNVGGSLRVGEMLAHFLDPQQVEAHLLFTYGEPGPVAHRATVPCHFLRSKGPQDVRAWFRARELVCRLSPDILHFHNPAHWLHGALAGTRFKKLSHLHGPFFLSDMGWLDRLLAARMPALMDGQVCITRGMRKKILEFGWGRPERTWTVYNAVDCPSFCQLVRRGDARRMFGLPEDAMILGMVCRLAWYKGCHDAIRILSRLEKKWHVVFCGDGPIQPDLKKHAEELGLEDRIHFTGMLDDVRACYAAMDAFLFLSRLEPFGLVIAEAMAARVPVFGLAGEGDFRDPQYPLVTPENSVFEERASPSDYEIAEDPLVLDKIAQRIADFSENPDRYTSMVERAHNWVRERFDGPIQAQSMTKVYTQVLGWEGHDHGGPQDGTEHSAERKQAVAVHRKASAARP